MRRTGEDCGFFSSAGKAGCIVPISQIGKQVPQTKGLGLGPGPLDQDFRSLIYKNQGSLKGSPAGVPMPPGCVLVHPSAVAKLIFSLFPRPALQRFLEHPPCAQHHVLP